MKTIKWIPLSLWNRWTPEQRREAERYYRIGLELKPRNIGQEDQKDWDEEQIWGWDQIK